MLLVYTSEITPRLQYILEFIGKEILEAPFVITNDETAFLNSEVPKINYSPAQISTGSYWITPVQLLFQTGVREEQPDVFSYEKGKALYKTEGDFPFDIFAASFYLLTRYEEYLKHEVDEYGRYAHQNALAFREGFLDLPMINIWLVAFRESLHHRFPGLLFKRQQFSCNITYDIDIAYSYLHKGVLRTVAGFVRSFLKGRWKEIDDRWLVLTGKKQDPYDCFEWLDALHLYCRLKPYYFFLVAKKQEGYDKNISTDVKAFRELIEYYASKYEVGLHPSWKSGDHPRLLKEELEWLEVITDKPVVSSRQHYIRFKTPDTFRKLVDTGIRYDFSMGYGSINGFRASVCSSYKWYDLEREQATALVISPFCFMDANSFYEQKQTPEQTYMELVKYYELVKKLNGNFIPIWHNHILGDDPQFKGWKEMFELFMKETVYWDAYSDIPVP
ncbi:polysaccharide deacetylase family protein [Flavitalea antarctica]